MNKISYKNYHRDGDYQRFENLFRNIFLNRFNLIRTFTGNRGKVLEIGCSNGIFLDIYKERKWETWGVEPSGNGVKAKTKGHKVIRSEIEKATLPKNYFDLVILNHTLEHLDDPVFVLKKVWGSLKKNGILYVDVPNAGGLASKMLGKYWPYRAPDEHKWQFTKNTLLEIFKKAGFKVLRFKSRSGFFEYANPLLEFKRRRFIFDIVTLPYSIIVTLLNIGDSMSMIGRKV